MTLLTQVTTPASPRPLSVLRIALASALLGQAFSLFGHLESLYGPYGFVQMPINEAIERLLVLRLGWLTQATALVGLDASTTIRLAFAVYTISLIGLLLGWHTRWMSAVAWMIHLAFKTSGNVSIYGVDEFANIALFYCMVLPVGHALSLDVVTGRVREEPSRAARLGFFILQLHMGIAYAASGIEKASGAQWWNGLAIWRALMRTDFAQFDCSWLASMPWFAALICWATLAIEIGYILFIWPRRTRRFWAAATAGMHVGIALSLGLWSFSAIMVALNSTFLVSPDPAGSAARHA